jgi:tRNA threonylcarbamoyladenosine biosynthesis protein TsaB
VLEQVNTVREGLAASAPPLPDLVAFGCGPGAFTGLRVACGVAQGLALGWDCPVAAIDSLTTLAWQARQEASQRHLPLGRIAVVLDVRMQEVAFAVFDPAAWLTSNDQKPSRWPTPLSDPKLCSPDEALSLLRDLVADSPPLLLAGDAFRVYPVLQEAQSSVLVEQPDAAAVADLAVIAFKLGRVTDPAQAAPTYLRDKVALDRHEQESLRAARRAQTD